MKMLKRFLAGILAVVLLISLPVSSFEVSAASKIPGFKAKVTEKNILKILNKYDKDGAYVMKKQINKGDNILWWFSNARIIDGMNTAVHEETHGYSHSYGTYSFSGTTTAYFVGNKKTVYVPHTTVYQSKEMANSIPKCLRTFRYNTYVAKPSAYLSSNVDGAYGLMNEFMAYRMGMSTTIALFPYYKAKKAGWDEWQVFINNCENDRLAYAEFKYYILNYLYYAKKHHPDVYNGIVNNKEFCKAYRTLESSYVKLIKEYEKDLKKIKKEMKAAGYQMQISDEMIMVYSSQGAGTGTGRFTSDYNKLQKELRKDKYLSIHRKLVK